MANGSRLILKEEALANAKEAIMCHIEGLRKAGESVPIEESTQTAIFLSYNTIIEFHK